MEKQSNVKIVGLKTVLIVLAFSISACSDSLQLEFVQTELFPLTKNHAHGSTIVELPNGDLLAAWFQGSGERWADDVQILGARLTRGSDAWSQPFTMGVAAGTVC